MAAYFRLVTDAESTIHDTIPLQHSFGLANPPSSATLEEHQRLDPRAIVHPVRVTWTGRRADMFEGNVGYRHGDAVVSDAFYERLRGGTLAPHVEVPVTCAKANKLGTRVLGPEVPYRWIAWTRPDDLLDRLDWARSSFVIREMAWFTEDPKPEGAEVVHRFRDRAELEQAAKDAFGRLAQMDAFDLVWEEGTTEALDMFVLPVVRVDGAYVSERLAQALVRPPKLAGFRILRADRSVLT